MLTADQLRDLTGHLEATYACTIVTRDEGPLGVGLSLVRTLARLLAPPLVVALDALESSTSGVSTTLPLPTGTLVILSPEATADALTHFRTLAHEAVHACQIQALGRWQATVDYVGSGELRAVREAHACVAAAFAEYLVTGHLPTTAAVIVASLESHLYLLSLDERELARGIAASGLAGILAGGCPPIQVCGELLAWLRARDLVVVEAYRATAVPT